MKPRDFKVRLTFQPRYWYIGVWWDNSTVAWIKHTNVQICLLPTIVVRLSWWRDILFEDESVLPTQEDEVEYMKHAIAWPDYPYLSIRKVEEGQVVAAVLLANNGPRVIKVPLNDIKGNPDALANHLVSNPEAIVAYDSYEEISKDGWAVG